MQDNIGSRSQISLFCYVVVSIILLAFYPRLGARSLLPGFNDLAGYRQSTGQCLCCVARAGTLWWSMCSQCRLVTAVASLCSLAAAVHCDKELDCYAQYLSVAQQEYIVIRYFNGSAIQGCKRRKEA